MATLHHYTVFGKGRFPLDMLRHDRASPTEPHGAVLIVATDGGYRRIALQSVINPTVDRWASFGWGVEQID